MNVSQLIRGPYWLRIALRRYSLLGVKLNMTGLRAGVAVSVRVLCLTILFFL